MTKLIFDGSQVNFLIAFLAGVISFFASCFLPLVPIYLAYLSGITTNKLKASQHKNLLKRVRSSLKTKIFINALVFTFGFIFVFTLLGATSNSIGRLLIAHKKIIQKLGGILFILIGLFILRIIKPQFFYQEKRINLPFKISKFQLLNSFLVGITFGFAWTPCIGPILAAILFWASQESSFLKGVSLLLSYGIGMGIPFLIIAIFFDRVSKKLTRATKMGRVLHFMTGLIIILMGILLMLNKVEFFSLKLLQFFKIDTLAL